MTSNEQKLIEMVRKLTDAVYEWDYHDAHAVAGDAVKTVIAITQHTDSAYVTEEDVDMWAKANTPVMSAEELWKQRAYEALDLLRDVWANGGRDIMASSFRGAPTYQDDIVRTLTAEWARPAPVAPVVTPKLESVCACRGCQAVWDVLVRFRAGQL